MQALGGMGGMGAMGFYNFFLNKSILFKKKRLIIAVTIVIRIET